MRDLSVSGISAFIQMCTRLFLRTVLSRSSLKGANSLCSCNFQIMPSFLNVIRTCDSSFREVRQHFMFSFHVCGTFTGFCCCCCGGLDSCRCPQLLYSYSYTVFLGKQLHYFYCRSYSFVSRYRLGVSGNKSSSRFWLLAQRSSAQKFHCQQMTSRDLEVGICGSEYIILQLFIKISHVLCFHIPFQFVLQQLGVLISIVKQHIRNYLDEIFGLIKVRLCTLLSSTLKHPYCLVNSTQRTAIGLKGLIIMPLDESSINLFTAKCGQRQISFSNIWQTNSVM